MIRVYIETEKAHIHFKNVDKVEIVDDAIGVYIEGRASIYLLDDVLTYEVRKDNSNYEI